MLKIQVDGIAVKILKNAPQAITANKDLISAVTKKFITDSVLKNTTWRAGHIRGINENKAEISAFMGKTRTLMG